MNSRTRLLNTIIGKPTDRVPISPFIWSNFVNDYFGYIVSDKELDEKCFSVYTDFDFDVMLRTCNISAPNDERYLDSKSWSVEVQKKKINDKKRHEITVVKTPEKVMTQIKEFQQITEYEEVSANIKCFIESEDDFLQFVKYQPSVPQYDCSRIKHAKEMIGDKGIIAPWTQGIFNYVSDMRKLDNLVLDMMINTQFYNNMMEYFMKRWIEISVQYAKAGADVLCVSGNIATATLLGREYFEKYVLAYEKKHMSTFRSYDTYALYHNCGDANGLYPAYNYLGIDIFESLVEPPYGDTDLDYAINVLNKDISLIGNIDQIDFLMNASKEAVKTECKKLVNKFKNRGGFVLATTDYLSEKTPRENLIAMRESVS